MLSLEATAREMAEGVDRTKLVISLIAQIMELPTSLVNKDNTITLHPNEDFGNTHVPVESRSDEAYNKTVRAKRDTLNLPCFQEESAISCSESIRWHLQLCFFIVVVC